MCNKPDDNCWGCLGVFAAVVLAIAGFIWYRTTVEINAHYYKEVGGWMNEAHSATLDQLFSEASADKIITEWEYYKLNNQHNKDAAEQTLEAAKQETFKPK